MSTGDVLWCMFLAYGFGVITTQLLVGHWVKKLRNEITQQSDKAADQ